VAGRRTRLFINQVKKKEGDTLLGERVVFGFGPSGHLGIEPAVGSRHPS